MIATRGRCGGLALETAERGNPIARPHLLARLDEGVRGPLTLLSAAAGTGKTTLLDQWQEKAAMPLARLTLAPGDGDPARVVARMAGALQPLRPGIGARLLDRNAAQRAPQLPDALIDLLNGLGQEPRDVALVLDNYQVLGGSPLGVALAQVIDFVPPQVHLLIATRAEPELPLPRLRVRGRLLQLGSADLSFTLPEAAAYLHAAFDALRAGLVATLHARTEGWAAGLAHAALAMRAARDLSEAVGRFSGRDPLLAGYLAREVFDPQPEAVRAFLLRTCHLDELNGPACDAATGRHDGQAMLQALERANLFVVPLDAERRCYRYHRLFAEYLQQRAQAERV